LQLAGKKEIVSFD